MRTPLVAVVAACAAACFPAYPDDWDGDGVTAVSGDCDDGDAARTPGLSEICDGIDNNCDGAVDEEPVDARLYPDGDGDGFGDDAGGVATCAPPGTGWVTQGGDCDDARTSVNPDTTEICGLARVSIYGDDLEAEVGWAVALADLDGDGLDDLLTGAPLAGEDAQGRAGVWRSPSAGAYHLGEADWLLDSGRTWENFGRSLAVGELRGGGPVVAVGAPASDGDGRIYLFDAEAAGGPDAYLVASVAWGAAGWSVATEDVDGDGVDDLLVGQPGGPAGSAGALVVLGPLADQTALEDADRALLKDDDYALGFVVATGDWDGDGLGDLLAGDPGQPAGPSGWDPTGACSRIGRVHVLLGASDAAGDVRASESDAALIGEGESDCFGASLASAASADGGPATFLAGAPDRDTFGGGVVVVTGGSVGSVEAADQTWLTGTANAHLGASIASSGGGEVVVGATYGLEGAGAVFVLTLDEAIAGGGLDPLMDGAILGPDDGDLVGGSRGPADFGWAVAVGDVDGDALTDVFIGAPTYGDAGGDSPLGPGASWLLTGALLGRD